MAEDAFVEITDPQTGKTFFANILTGECTWDKPQNAKVKPKDPNGEWWELFDENHKLLMAIQNSSIGKRVSVALQRASMMGTTTDMPDFSSMGNSQNGGSRLARVEQPNKNGGYQFGSSPPGGASPTSGQNGAGESVWQQAKKFGIGQPVNNPEAAMSMNPFNRKGSIAPQQFERPPTLPKDLQLHITQFRIDGFAQRYFAEHRRGIFRRRVPVEKMLEWQKDTLKSPLMVMNKEYHKEAQKCFKLLQRIMGDRGGVPANSEQHRKEIQELLDKGINSGILRDEIYVQLCKQLSHNPQPESIFRGWQFMCVITIAFPPSKNFEEYLKSFVQQHFGVRENRVDILSKHAHKKLLRICKVGPRGKTISLQEIERAQEAPFLASVFGETLDDIMKTQTAEFPELKLPRILPFLAEAILTLNGCKTEGVFRVPGDVDAVTDLKCRIEKNEYSMAGIVDPNVPGSLLKSWLRDLADPLIPPEHYQPCIDVGANEMAPEAPRNAARIVEQLPEVNRRVVQYMIRFLRIVGDPQNQPFTKMSVGNLAMVFAPNFLRCPSDSPATIFENTKYEQAWLRILITSNVLG
ncbi:Rho GTPase activation protein [Cladochytrium replicatum]|nr:Rho GTPase activation protein [Cladochytrium replicatum]